MKLGYWGYPNGQIPWDKMIEVEGQYFEPETARRVLWAQAEIRRRGGNNSITEGYRPLGNSADVAVGRRGGAESETSTKSSNQFYQFGRYLRWLDTGGKEGTPSAADPGTSNHGWGQAGDFNTNNMALRAEVFRQAGLLFTISSESWHADSSGDPTVALPSLEELLGQTNTQNPTTGEDDMPTLDEFKALLDSELTPIETKLQQLIGLPETQQGFIDQIQGQYQSVLGRDADPGGLSMFLNLMVNAGWDIGKVNAALLASDEYKLRWIASQYDQLLTRQAAPAELTGWLNFMHAGHSFDDVVNAIKGSDEYKSKH